ncbi:sporulation protein YabP [Thermosediminibacter oceani]|uniref:Sporulation protein YabP n=1 Tax=Thermosediminibacter oceani (strain ATCC BAA-1034 / DSM 16646 / JW/IW-1228P) TaxID=555079 RepID=D9RZJ9_THEOJ|nr:sporulation protein YabP [Thermosediminibacter oceani]ADL06897.1 sporulation protein YabP [Thermosediminibacter oceani DSM 16646]
MDEKKSTKHRLTLQDREILEIDGVLNVEKFTDEDIILSTEKGMLNIKGEKMHMKQLNLDQGLIVVEGFVKMLAYTEEASAAEKGKGLLNRLFR